MGHPADARRSRLRSREKKKQAEEKVNVRARWGAAVLRSYMGRGEARESIEGVMGGRRRPTLTKRGWGTLSGCLVLKAEQKRRRDALHFAQDRPALRGELDFVVEGGGGVGADPDVEVFGFDDPFSLGGAPELEFVFG